MIKRYSYLVSVGVMLVVAGLFLLAGQPVLGQEDPAAPAPQFLQAIYEAWSTSPHNDATAEAFIHWDADGEVEADCAKCHSTPGYIDYLGADGSAAGSVDSTIPLGTTVNCDACHNEVASNMTSVTFPSGAVIENLDDSARCMECHQGRAAGVTVDERIAATGLTDVNAVSADLRFVNIHYYAAAASLYGAEVGGGYEFAGASYQPRFEHVAGYDTCISCHNPHTLEVKVDECAACHEDVETVEDVREIRMQGSMTDYDGDGDTDEGIVGEIETLQEMLYTAMVSYSAQYSGAAILYDSARYPYWFADANANGAVDEGEESFAAFTPLLLQAAYNYQVTQKDHAGYVHSAKYHIELLFDSIEQLNAQLAQPVDLSAANRNDPGHFDGTAEAFRHWDAEGAVPGTCARCHTAGGVPQFIANNANIAAEPTSSLRCTTCHDLNNDFAIYNLASVRFPSGAMIGFGEEEPSNMCLMCHQGRESTLSVNNAIRNAGVGDDEVTDALSFRNIHYFAAGATLFGSEAQGIYQYEGKEYNGLSDHPRLDTCTECHNEHSLEVDIVECADCHESLEDNPDVRSIRQEGEDVEAVDYDGDGDVTEPIAAEIESFQTALLAAIQAYANNLGTPIGYDAHAHPYWYMDGNGDGELTVDEVTRDTRFLTWTPNLLRAAYNYQYSKKDPGAFAHNPDYVMQALYDSIESIGGDVSTFTRPPLLVVD